MSYSELWVHLPRLSMGLLHSNPLPRISSPFPVTKFEDPRRVAMGVIRSLSAVSDGREGR